MQRPRGSIGRTEGNGRSLTPGGKKNRGKWAEQGWIGQRQNNAEEQDIVGLQERGRQAIEDQTGCLLKGRASRYYGKEIF
ncbi:hypothetical protein GOP47_0031244 [Adiantum capillus-veneris]|nr:hypothetical protein GOP47_0031244 [Adiantum capillus-veneris]